MSLLAVGKCLLALLVLAFGVWLVVKGTEDV